MAKYKPYERKQLTMVPISLELQLVPGTLEHTIEYAVSERLDLSSFDAEYKNDKTGRNAYDPRILLKVVLLGYSRGMTGSRKLERACRENVTFMALTCGQSPDYSTFANFVSGIGEKRVEELFAQVLMYCEAEGLLGGTHFSLDGLKLAGNASKEWSGTRKDLEKKHEKLKELVRQAMAEHKRNDRRGKGGDAGMKRLSRLKQKAKKIERFLAESKPKIGRRGEEIQSNVTDNDSAKMKTSHGIVQGYNANAMVDSKHQIVVSAQAFGASGDEGAVKPMIEEAKANLEAAGCGTAVLEKAVVSADTGYFTKENLEACDQAGVDAYIPDRMFRKRDPRFADARRYRRPTDKHKKQYKSVRKIFGPKDFHFDASGRLVCPAGHRLCGSGSNYKTDGYQAVSYRALKSACGKCPLRTKCLRDPNQTTPRQVRIFGKPTGEGVMGRMKQKIDTIEGRRIYSLRLGNVEPVFANIRAQKGMNRFTLRGRRKVNVQWKLYCLVHNLEKLGGYGDMFSNN